MGNGLGCWNTMPTYTRSALASILKMSCPSNSIVPSVLTVSTKSHMRLNVRSSVDFPHPEGPMKAVARFLGISSVMLFNAWKSPYHRLKSRMESMLSTPSTLRWISSLNSLSIVFSISRTYPSGNRQDAGLWVPRKSAGWCPFPPYRPRRRRRYGRSRGPPAPCCGSR